MGIPSNEGCGELGSSELYSVKPEMCGDVTDKSDPSELTVPLRDTEEFKEAIAMQLESEGLLNIPGFLLPDNQRKTFLPEICDKFEML